MRMIKIVAGILIAVVVVCAAALWLIDVNQFRPQIEAQLQKRLGRPVTLGAIGLKLFPLSLRVENVSIGEAPSFHSSLPFVTAKEIDLKAGLLPLLQKQLQIDSLVLQQPSVELIKSAQGVWNYASLGGSSPSSGSSAGEPPVLQELEIIDGRAAITDHQAREPRSVYDHADLKLHGFAPGKKFDFELGVHLPGKGNQTISLKGVGGPLQPAGAAPDLEGHLSIRNVSLAGLLNFPDTTARADTDGAISGDADLQMRNQALTARGGLTLSGGSLTPSTLRYDVSVRNFSAPQLKFTADLDQLNVVEVQKLAAAPPKSSAAPHPNEPSKVTGAGTLSIGKLRHNDLLVNHVKATCTLDRGLIKLAPIEAEVAGGRQTGAITIDTRPQHPTFAMNTALDRIDANQLLSSTTTLKGILYGLLAGKANATFVSRPGEDIARSLNGDVHIDLTDGKLQGINLFNEMAVLGKFLAATRQAETFTTIARLAGTMKIKDGVANTDDLSLEFGGGSLSATGLINLVDQSLNLHLTTALGRDLSQRVGGTQVGGFMSTVLSNPQGELVIPAIVTGTFARPHFAPDAERFAQMKLRGLVNAIRGNPAQPAAQGTQPSPQGKAVDSLIDLFRRKK